MKDVDEFEIFCMYLNIFFFLLPVKDYVKFQNEIILNQKVTFT